MIWRIEQILALSAIAMGALGDDIAETELDRLLLQAYSLPKERTHTATNGFVGGIFDLWVGWSHRLLGILFADTKSSGANSAGS
jgi:hypothetical protein